MSLGGGGAPGGIRTKADTPSGPSAKISGCEFLEADSTNKTINLALKPKPFLPLNPQTLKSQTLSPWEEHDFQPYTQKMRRTALH